MKNMIITSAVQDDGTMIEMIYQPKDNNTTFAIYKDGEIRFGNSIEVEDHCLVPFYANNDLIKNKVILFPSNPEEYGTDKELVLKVQNFIHKYLQVDETFEKIAAYYVLFTWVYERFNELPYLRALGDYGSGKSRFLKVVGSLCYKPIFANGAITISPIFRILELSHGTLVLNEADFRESDVSAEITKILNNGFEKNFPVLRSESRGNGFIVKAFDVFGPKILGARERFQDKALESRFITEEMDNGNLREDIPINLPDSFWDEALAIRNQLLMWRFKNYHAVKLKSDLVDRSIEPRLNQILIPLVSIISDPNLIEEVRNLVKQMNTQILKDRGMSKEAEFLEVILLLYGDLNMSPTVKAIMEKFNEGKNERECITAKKAGWWLRDKLNLILEKTREGYVLDYQKNTQRIAKLCKKYGLATESKEGSPSSQPSPDSLDVNVVNDVNIR